MVIYKTYCCIKCGEIFVVDLELLHHAKTDLQTLCTDKICPQCNGNLQTCLANYPENIYYNGSMLINKNQIDKLQFEKTELRDVYVLN